MNFDQDDSPNANEPMLGDYFPTNENSDKFAKRLGGFDIYKSGKAWQAIIAVENTENSKRSIKWFRWQQRQDEWKIGLCNMKVDYMDFDNIKNKIKILKKIYDI